MMTTITIITVVALIIAISAVSAWVYYEDKITNNEAAIKWAREMEAKYNVNVALYEDESGRIIDYRIYKL